MASLYSFNFKDVAAKIVASMREEAKRPPTDHQEARRREELMPVRLEVLAGCIAEDPMAVLSVSMAALKRHQDQITSLQGGIQQLRAEVEEHVGRWVAAESALAEKTAEAAALRAELAAVRELQIGAEMETFFLSDSLGTARAEITRLQAEVDGLKGELGQAKEERGRALEQLGWYRPDEDGYESEWGGESNWEGNEGVDI